MMEPSDASAGSSSVPGSARVERPVAGHECREFDRERKRLDLRVDFAKGLGSCPECERAGCAVKDTRRRRGGIWISSRRQAYLTARVPRVDPEHKVRLVAVPWARPRSGSAYLARGVGDGDGPGDAVATLAGLVGESDMRIWRIVHRCVTGRSRRRTSKASSGSGSMRPARGVGMTTSRCSRGSGRAPRGVRGRGSRS